MSRRLLLVESSATMRRVLGEHLRSLDFEVEEVAEHALAVQRLNARYATFEEEYAALVFGWPALDDDAGAAELAERVGREDLRDLPVIVMTTDRRAGTRAWAAARDRTDVLPWQRYRDIDGLLERLTDGHRLDRTATPVSGSGSVPASTSGLAPASAPDPALPKSDDDIRLLLIDDSATMRRSLHDLFAPHGYRILLAAGRADALELARVEAIDIAVIDFYLGDDRGDHLCRELVDDPATGDVVCAVLTGTYSDQIIRSSLRAGALECLFKNESAELLLNRVEALARLVRQRRRIAGERRLLDRVVDAVAGTALVLDPAGRIRHVGHDALAMLGHTDGSTLIGRPVAVVVDALPPAESSAASRGDVIDFEARLQRADGSPLPARLERIVLGGDAGSVLLFRSAASSGVSEGSISPTRAPASGPGPEAAPEADSETDSETGPGSVRAIAPAVPAPSGIPDAPAAPAARGRVPFVRNESVAGFEELAARFLDGREPIEREASLLLLRVWRREPGRREQRFSVANEPSIAARLERRMLDLYRRKDHVVALGDGRYGFLLRHLDVPQSWWLTRRIMQLVNRSFLEEGGPRLATTASLKHLAGEPPDAGRLFGRALEALELVDAKGLDRALLIDPRRMLPVYPAPPRGEAAAPAPRSSPSAEHAG